MIVYKLVTFDINGTLLKLKHPPGKIYADVAASFGVVSNPKVLKINFKEQWLKMNSQYPNFGLRHSMTWQDWWKQLVMKSFHGAYEKSPTADLQVAKTADKLIDLLGTPNEWVTVDGSENVLSFLRSNGAKLGVISNFDPRLRSILSGFKICKYFDFILTSYEAGYEKPDTRIFELAENIYKCQFGELSKKEILHVGDSYEHDYIGAKSVGWDVALLCRDKQEATLGSNVFKCSNMVQLKHYLAESSIA